MKEIYVVVHPEATHHFGGIVGGWFDSVLTQSGVGYAENIAESLARRLRGTTVEIFSSDLLRPRRTAYAIANRLNTSLTIDRDLREKSHGEAEGKPQSWLKERSIPLPEFGERLRHDEGIDGAGTRMDLATRIRRDRAHPRVALRTSDTCDPWRYDHAPYRGMDWYAYRCVGLGSFPSFAREYQCATQRFS